MIVECERCGAPLDVRENQQVAKCNYCRATQRVKSLRTREMRTPPDWKPPPVWTPQDHRRERFPQPMQHRPASSAGPIVGAVLGVFVLAGVGSATFFLHRNGTLSGLDLVSPPTLGQFEIGPVFPVRFDRPGVAGGPVDAMRMGPACRGHFARAPHALLRLRQQASLSITTLNNNSVDLTMAVRGPDGAFRCDDDSGEGSNPRVHGPLPPGDYRVWVGTYSASQSAPFTLSVQVNATGNSIDLNGLSPDAAPQAGAFDLEANGGFATGSGTAAGFVEGTHVNSSCRGYYNSAPTATMRITQPRFLSLTTEGSADITMLLRDPGGHILCDDDSGYAANPRIETMASPGVYQMWVGIYSQGQSSPYTFSVASEVVPPVNDQYGFAPDGAPAFGTLELAQNATAQTYRGVAIRRVDGAPVDPSCSEGFPADPTIAIRTQTARRVSVRLAAQHDLRLLVRSADGASHCQGPRASSMNVPLELHPGTTLLWVGTYDRERHVPYVMSVTPAR